MAAPRNRRHILITAPPEAEAFTSRRTGGEKAFTRPTNRLRHARQLTDALRTATEQVRARREVEPTVAPPDVGIYVQFQAPAGVDLKLESLENKPAGIEVRGVQRTRLREDAPFIETAT